MKRLIAACLLLTVISRVYADDSPMTLSLTKKRDRWAGSIFARARGETRNLATPLILSNAAHTHIAFGAKRLVVGDTDFTPKEPWARRYSERGANCRASGS